MSGPLLCEKTNYSIGNCILIRLQMLAQDVCGHFAFDMRYASCLCVGKSYSCTEPFRKTLVDYIEIDGLTL